MVDNALDDLTCRALGDAASDARAAGADAFIDKGTGVDTTPALGGKGDAIRQGRTTPYDDDVDVDVDQRAARHCACCPLLFGHETVT